LNEFRTLDQFLRSGSATEVLLVKIEHPDGDVHVWDGLGYLEADVGGGVQTFKGLGRLGSVSIGASDTEVQVTDVVFVLSGVDPEYLEMLSSTVKGNTATVWKAFLGADRLRVQFLEQISESVLDQPSFSIEPNGQATMRLVSNGGFYFLDVQSSAVWDVEEQNNFLISQGIDPTTDTGFDLMSELKNTQITWERPG
jgi:hypothetical protein